MAPPVYSHRFIGVNNATSDGTFTCPAGYVAVVVQLSAYFDSVGAGQDGTIGANIDGTTIWHQASETLTLGGAVYLATTGRWVLYPGETLYMSHDPTCDLYAGGYLLTE
jgi:hypothetical protein